MINEIGPCPFCGEDPPDVFIDFEEFEDYECRKYGAAARCLDCDAKGPETRWFKDKKNAEQAAIDLWNLREGAHTHAD